MRRIYSAAGGRKMFAQYLAVILVTAMALHLRPAFWEYAAAVCGILGIAVGGIAYEDTHRKDGGGPPPTPGDP
jgi:hypothetical protein